MAGNLPIFSLIGLAVLALGALLHIVGLATPDWSHIKDYTATNTYGLWKYCVGDSCTEYGQVKSSELEATEAFAIIGMLFSVVAGGIALVHVIFGLQGQSPNVVFPMAVVGAAGASFISVLICVIIWGAAINKPSGTEIGYSFALSIVGGILVGVGGCVFFVGAKMVRT